MVLDTSNIITDAVKQWLQEDLQNTTKGWKFGSFTTLLTKTLMTIKP